MIIVMSDTLITSTPTAPTTCTRRSLLRRSAAGLLAAGLPTGWVGSAFASDAPETADVKIGIIALTDCSPFVIAHEKGFFKEFGINSALSKEASWAAIRDKLVTGDNQATHMLFGMPFSLSMGLGGAAATPIVTPWIINRNGQGITLANKFKGKVGADPTALKPMADEAKKAGTPLTFAMTFPTGTHAMWMRYYLAAGGINPDSDVSLITIPPPQMVANMKVDKMDGYCVGEPWNARAMADDIGYTSVTTQDLWKDHPEKVCAFTKAFAESNPKTVKAMLKALHKASVWLDVLENRKEQVSIVSKPSYVNCPAEIILGRLMGQLDYGDGRTKQDPNYMRFSDRNCNYPQAKFGKWWLTQFSRWGMVSGAPDYDGMTQQVLMPGLYEEAMKEIGYSHGGADLSPETFFDGTVFDPAKCGEYAASFKIHSRKA
jgi:nitrate/nitrite transport system substrate-binding protein